MTFLNPTILFGLIAAGIPLIIHLFNLRRPKTVDFSSLAFLDELRQQTLRRLRLRQWLLLALRMLVIVFLVLAFARPTVQSEAVGRIVGAGRTATVAILDNSISMLQRDERGAYFSQARDELLAIADDLESGDELTIIPLVAERDAGSARLKSPTLVRDWIEEVQVAAGRPRLAHSIGRALATLDESDHPNKEIFIFSDIQSTTFSDSLDVEIPPGVRLYLVPVGTTTHDNIAVMSVAVRSSIVDQGQPVRLQAQVANFGRNDRENWGLSAYLAGERVAQATVDIPAGEMADVNLTLIPSDRGWLPGYVEIEDDGFDPDNRRYFTLHVPEVRRILIVKGSGTDTEFLQLAMSRQLSRDGGVFTIETVEEAEFSSTPIGDFDALVLHGVRRYSSGQVTTIENFVSTGGGLLVFVGDAGPAPDQQSFLRALGAGSVDAMLGQAESETAVATLDKVDAEHPVFLGVFEQDQFDAPDVGHPSLFRAAHYVAGRSDEHTIISSTADFPVLQEVRGMAGRILLAPWLAQPDWTDLPFRGFFVPLIHRSIYYLTSVQGDSGDGVIAGSEAQVRLAAPQQAQLAIVSDDGAEWIPEQRGGLQGLVLSIPATIQDPGVYTLISDDAIVSRIAVNGDPAESDLRTVDPAAAAAAFERPGSNRAVVLQSSILQPDSPAGNRAAGVEIWNVFLGLALLLLVVEMLVAKR